MKRKAKKPAIDLGRGSAIKEAERAVLAGKMNFEQTKALILLLREGGKDGDFAALERRVKQAEDRIALLESIRGVNRSPATSTPGGLRLG